MEELDVLRLILGLFFLTYGSISDLRTRRVSNIVWIFMGLFAILVLVAQMLLEGYSVYHHLIVVPVAILYFDVFWERESVFKRSTSRLRVAVILLYLLALAIIAFQSYHFFRMGGEELTRFLQFLTIPVMILVAYAFYVLGLLRGGADAKAFMAIALLVPIYPVVYQLPIIGWTEPNTFSIAFPFALVALLNAALLLVFAPLAFLIYNLWKGSLKVPESLFGYEVDTGNLPKFVWLMQRIENGRIARELLPRRSRDIEEEAKKLIEAGHDRVWVTPQIPFLIPLTVSFALSFLLGNLLFGLFSLFA
ncbi:MAG: A24 family peptidase C-terminal domain-containing protein [Thermoplasmata archaeon]